MQTEVGDTQESLALLMVELILTMGTRRFHALLQDLINSPDKVGLPKLLAITHPKLTKKNKPSLT
jgi:hypothetical protein